MGAISATSEGTLKAPIYLDHHATTPLDPRVVKVVLHHMEHTVGNPNSAEHGLGETAALVVEDARRQVARLIKAEPREVHFTSGATESVWLAIHGFVQALIRARPGRTLLRIAHLTVEHHAVIDACRQVEALYPVQVLPIEVDGTARIDMESFRSICAEGVDLLCVMAANNEVGTVYDIGAISTIAQAAGAIVFSDATQAVGKILIDFERSGLDAMALSGHKFHGPKGVGALVLRNGTPFRAPFTLSEEGAGIRPGTPNVPGIAGIGEACGIAAKEMAEDAERIASLRDRLRAQLQRNVDGLVVNGAYPRLPNNLSVSVPDIPAQALVARVRDRVALSTGSACRTGVPGPSHVLRAMRLPENLQNGTIRIGLGRFNTEEEVVQAGALIAREIHEIRGIMAA